MFNKKNPSGYHTPIQGIDQKTLVYGEKTEMAEFCLRQGSVVPLHRHPHEQTGYLVSGMIRLTIASETFECRSGDSWCIPSDTEHGAEVIQDAVAIEVFSPLRTDYLPE